MVCTRSPDTSQSPAIDPLFACTAITNEARQLDWPFYWTATTHAGLRGGAAAMYVAFGRAGGCMSPGGMTGGPQGDVIRIYNFVRLARGGGLSSQGKEGR